MNIKNIWMMLVLTGLAFACNNAGTEADNEELKETQTHIPVLSFDEFAPMLNKSNDTTYIINFWATWCKPCIEEMPAFTRLDSIYSKKKVQVVLVSLDFPKNLESQVIPFIKKNNIRSKVVLLNDPDANAWINRVDSNWSGAIPATVIYNSNSRDFYERTFTYEELQDIVESKL